MDQISSDVKGPQGFLQQTPIELVANNGATSQSARIVEKHGVENDVPVLHDESRH